ncbi:MAG: energy transducer TonB [Gemmatimonadota bacterium]
MAQRLLVVTFLAAVVTFGLLWVMQALIGAAGKLSEGKAPFVVDFVRVKRDNEPEVKKRELPDRKPPEQPPPPPEIDFATNLNPDEAVGSIVLFVDVGLELAGATNLGTGGADRDIVPLVRIEPQYPMRAEQRGIEGWVELVFTITAVGTVKDVVVTASHPGSVFDRAAVRAVRKWKYTPKVENGAAVERTGVRQRLKFDLDHR